MSGCSVANSRIKKLVFLYCQLKQSFLITLHNLRQICQEQLKNEIFNCCITDSYFVGRSHKHGILLPHEKDLRPSRIITVQSATHFGGQHEQLVSTKTQGSCLM
jgi:hypothetical protein